jgi:hypothetical protein
MLGALQKLGIKWEQLDERTHVVHGAGGACRTTRPTCSWAMPAPRSVR